MFDRLTTLGTSTLNVPLPQAVVCAVARPDSPKNRTLANAMMPIDRHLIAPRTRCFCVIFSLLQGPTNSQVKIHSSVNDVKKTRENMLGDHRAPPKGRRSL